MSGDRQSCGDEVEAFTVVARPLADEIAFLFGDGFVTLTAAEARVIHAKMGAALAMLDRARRVGFRRGADGHSVNGRAPQDFSGSGG